MPADHTHVLGARYALTSELARDSSFAVYDAEDHRSGSPTGIAVSLHPDGRAARRRRSLGPRLVRADHPRLISAYDSGAYHSRSFVAFHRPGRDLATELAVAPYPAGRVAQIGAELASALDALHRTGIKLGALHPGHAGIDADGSARLSPWPLAPPPAGWGGAAAWSSPEALSGAAPSAAGDIWSLGAVLLSALAGAGPGELSAAAAESLADRLRKGADPVLIDAVGRSMEADPSRRFASAGEMTAALERGRGVAVGRERTVADAPVRGWRAAPLVTSRATAFASGAITVVVSATVAGLGLNSLGGGSVALSCAAGHQAAGSCAVGSPGPTPDANGNGLSRTTASGSSIVAPPAPVGAPVAATTGSAAVASLASATTPGGTAAVEPPMSPVTPGPVPTTTTPPAVPAPPAPPAPLSSLPDPPPPSRNPSPTGATGDRSPGNGNGSPDGPGTGPSSASTTSGIPAGPMGTSWQSPGSTGAAYPATDGQAD
ncbi:MAG: serine/threonine protein kinase, bacterial [Acidimicrobiaceae bacterium]|nr:serine/threonine protein kinase, bacterial [Acidimicrobiaceae bacterium]